MTAPISPPDDDAFARHLEQAGSELRADHLSAAESEIAAALTLRPGDVRALNLRGLILFRAARYEEAKQIFAELFTQKPEDMALCLNLGLVELRLGHNAEAAIHLERVVALEPGNQRVLGYLGLALMRKGDLDQAHDILQQAGQPELARQVEALRKGTGGRRHSDGRVELDAPAVEAERRSLKEAVAATTTAEPVAAFVARTLIGDPTAEEPFWLGHDTLALRVDGRLATRMVGAVALAGQLVFEPLTRRVRGQATDEPVGAGAEALMAAVGHGRLLFAVDAATATHTLLKLDDDILYVREPYLFAFEEAGLVWESGRIPGGGQSGSVVQFRGHGRVVVRTARALVTVKADPESPLFVEPSRLVGWIGRVVPRHQAAAAGAAAFVECTGEGVILLERGAATPSEAPAPEPAVEAPTPATDTP